MGLHHLNQIVIGGYLPDDFLLLAFCRTTGMLIPASLVHKNSWRAPSGAAFGERQAAGAR
jgi:hypothetical protein